MSDMQKNLNDIIQPAASGLSAAERLKASTMFNYLVLCLHAEHYDKHTDTYSDDTGGGTYLELSSVHSDKSEVGVLITSESNRFGDTVSSRIDASIAEPSGRKSQLVFHFTNDTDVEVSWVDLDEEYHGSPGAVSVRGLSKKLKQIRGVKKPESFNFRAASTKDVAALERLMVHVSMNSQDPDKNRGQEATEQAP